MPKIIETVYENGVFKPLQKVDLKEAGVAPPNDAITATCKHYGMSKIATFD
ncbi:MULTISPECIES: antitoxin family protein [unclassified Archaeoglobus]|jgi:predicted nucleic acid-binding protein|uniref:antitoxin family protein n=1 Tax=unclassified Archaeoglobus TaxID=2643606 RepID=UPI0025C2F194|nr:MULTISPECIES: antitoxin AF2212-like protein [unclassified Archaeoglobus]